MTRSRIVLCIGLGVLIGAAANRNDWLSRQARAATVNVEDDTSGQNKSQDDSALPQDTAPFQGVIAPTVSESVPHWPQQPRAPKGAPNVLFVMMALHQNSWVNRSAGRNRMAT